jgi:hypothetical protein
MFAVEGAYLDCVMTGGDAVGENREGRSTAGNSGCKSVRPALQ